MSRCERRKEVMNEILVLVVLAADIFLAYLLGRYWDKYWDKEIREEKEKKEKEGEKK